MFERHCEKRSSVLGSIPFCRCRKFGAIVKASAFSTARLELKYAFASPSVSIIYSLPSTATLDHYAIFCRLYARGASYPAVMSCFNSPFYHFLATFRRNASFFTTFLTTWMFIPIVTLQKHIFGNKGGHFIHIVIDKLEMNTFY
jgi:hypothetical protein